MTDTAKRLAEIRARVAAATEGPWEAGGPSPSVSVLVMVDGGHGYPEPEPPIWEPVCICHQSQDFKTRMPSAEHDAEFIAHSRRDTPFLLAELDEALELIVNSIGDPPTRTMTKQDAMDFLRKHGRVEWC